MLKGSLFITIICLAYLAPVAQAWKSNILIEEAYGSLRGYTQTPKGGNYNTTSEERPSFKEIDLSQDAFFHTEATLYSQDYFAFIEYFRIRPHHDAILAEDLVTHAKFIPAGTPFETSTHYNWYRLGAGFDASEYFKQWLIEFSLAANWLKYSYKFSSPIAKSARDFNLVGATLGLKIQRHLSKNWLFDVSGEGSLPITELRLFNGSIGLSYLFMLDPYIAFRPRASIEGLYIDYEDNQKIPNHLRYQSLPYIALGLSIEFGNHF